MNKKINFISNTEIEPVEFVKKRLDNYTEMVMSLDNHFKIRGKLIKKWDNIVINPEFVVIEEENEFKIKSNADNIVLVTIDNKDLAENIAMLMNLAFREGAKQIIKILEYL